jgi:hypothetical protein
MVVIMNDEQQAFPDGLLNQDGMTLRDYFAAKAMQGFLAAKAWHPDFNYPADFNFDAGKRAADAVSEAAYKYADQMLKEREA